MYEMLNLALESLLCPLLVYPADIAFPSVLPSVALFKSMYSTGELQEKQISFFKKALFGISICKWALLWWYTHEARSSRDFICSTSKGLKKSCFIFYFRWNISNIYCPLIASPESLVCCLAQGTVHKQLVWRIAGRRGSGILVIQSGLECGGCGWTSVHASWCSGECLCHTVRFSIFFFWWFRLTRAGVHQINQAAAYIFAILLFSAAYKQDWLGELTNVEIMTKNRYHWGKETDMILNKTGGGNLPFISFSLLDRQGQSYNTSAVVNSDGTENSEAIAQLGMPFFSTAYIIGKAFVCMAAAAAFTSAILTNWSTIVSLIKREERPVDPDRQVCQQMKGFPMWWACVTCLLSLFKLLIRCPGGLGQSLSLQSQWRLQLLEWVTVGFLHGDCYVPCCSLSCWGQWVSKFYSIPWND